MLDRKIPKGTPRNGAAAVAVGQFFVSQYFVSKYWGRWLNVVAAGPDRGLDAKNVRDIKRLRIGSCCRPCPRSVPGTTDIAPESCIHATPPNEAPSF